MKGLNQVNLIGNVGQDPELRYTQAGDAVVNFSMATSESWKNKEGELVEQTEWHRCVAWRKPAEVLGQYLHKGDRLYVQGKIKSREYEKQDGTKARSTEIVVDNFIFLSAPKDGEARKPQGEEGQITLPDGWAAPATGTKPVAPALKRPDDDLPF